MRTKYTMIYMIFKKILKRDIDLFVLNFKDNPLSKKIFLKNPHKTSYVQRMKKNVG